jgi:hypothetical protein
MGRAAYCNVQVPELRSVRWGSCGELSVPSLRIHCRRAQGNLQLPDVRALRRTARQHLCLFQLRRSWMMKRMIMHGHFGRRDARVLQERQPLLAVTVQVLGQTLVGGVDARPLRQGEEVLDVAIVRRLQRSLVEHPRHDAIAIFGKNRVCLRRDFTQSPEWSSEILKLELRTLVERLRSGNPQYANSAANH